MNETNPDTLTCLKKIHTVKKDVENKHDGLVSFFFNHINNKLRGLFSA